MKDAIEELIKVNSKGITNSDCAHYLGLQRDHGGQQQNYLTYSVLGILLKENRIIGEKISNIFPCFVNHPQLYDPHLYYQFLCQYKIF